MKEQRWLGVGGVVLCLVVLMAVALPVGASADQAHYFAGQAIGGTGTGSGQLNLLPPRLEEKEASARYLELISGGSGLAVNESSGDVYVTDSKNDRISEFDPARPPAEQFVRAFGWGVADGSPEPQICTTTCRAGTAGSEPGQLEEPRFIAIDDDPASPSHGDVYVGGVGRAAADERDQIQIEAEGGSFTLALEGHSTTPIPYKPYPPDPSAREAFALEIEQALEAVPSIGSGNVTVGIFLLGSTGALGFGIDFVGSLAETDLPKLTVGTSQLLPTSSSVRVQTVSNGSDFAPELITKFTAGGELVTTWGTGGQLDGSTTPQGTFAPITGLEVTPTGDLIASTQNGRIYRFGDDGALVATSNEGFRSPAGAAVDGSGSIFGSSGGAVTKFTPEGVEVGRVLPTPGLLGAAQTPTGLAADVSSDDLYVDLEGHSIADFSSRCEPAQGFCEPSRSFGEGTLKEAAGISVDSTDGTVYAADAGTDQILAFPVAIEADTGTATDVHATTATLNASVDPFGSGVTECSFEYGTTTEYDHFADCEGTVGGGSSPVPVAAELNGLTGGTTYHYRLLVKNADGQLRTQDATFTTEAAPTIDEAFATDVTAGSAILNARIDPHGVGGSYRFEYGSTTAYGQATAEESIGTGSAGVLRSQAIAGLVPDTTWHFRVVVEDAKGDTITSEDHTFVFIAAGPGACPDEALRTGPSAQLPDCRGYELVTPPQKNGALIGATFPSNFAPQISPDGLRVGAVSIQCFAGPLSCIASREAPGQVFEFTRASGSWQAQPLSPPASAFPTFTWQTFGAEPGTLLFRAPLTDSTPDLFYLRRTDGPLVDVGPYSEHLLQSNLRPVILLSHLGSGTLVYGTGSPVWAMGGAPVNTSSLYEYIGSGNIEPQLVGVSGGAGDTDLISACGTMVKSTFGSLSTDGRTVFFKALKCPTGTGVNAGDPVAADALYERIDGARTIKISAGSPQDCSSACQGSTPRAASFEGASSDGSKVFFTSTQQLSDEGSQDNNPGDSASAPGCASTSATTSGCNLYLSECPAHCEDPSQRRLIDVSAGAQDSGGPKVQGATAISPDGTHAYFVAKGVLTSAADAEGKKAQLGANNLYLYERDEAHPDGRLSFVATLSPNDSTNWRPAGTQGIGFANTTPDGRFLVFESHRGLTPDAKAGEGPTQIYRFDAVTGALTRVSIGRQGFADDGNTGGPIADASIAASFRAYELGDGPARANPTMSGDGRYVFFESPVGLAPGAPDEVKTGNIEHPGSPEERPELAQNVYEWEQQGTGSCTEPQGCVSMITDGTDVAGAGKIVPAVELLGTDESGEDVFFATNSQLVGKDTDTQRDYYDARVNGGEAPEAEQVLCEGDACKGQGTAAAPLGSPATPNVNGPEEGPKHPRGVAKCPHKKAGHGSRCQNKHKGKGAKQKHGKKHKSGHHQPKKKNSAKKGH
ncbi:MAG TPA: hypothetical protein VHZ54_10520 [Solirubrobacterales bacterium]|nr:hypothetical protein [Solirubrobacterales bacterium]